MVLSLPAWTLTIDARKGTSQRARDHIERHLWVRAELGPSNLPERAEEASPRARKARGG